jgi:hypothetical protein
MHCEADKLAGISTIDAMLAVTYLMFRLPFLVSRLRGLAELPSPLWPTSHRHGPFEGSQCISLPAVKERDPEVAQYSNQAGWLNHHEFPRSYSHEVPHGIQPSSTHFDLAAPLPKNAMTTPAIAAKAAADVIPGLARTQKATPAIRSALRQSHHPLYGFTVFLVRAGSSSKALRDTSLGD